MRVRFTAEYTTEDGKAFDKGVIAELAYKHAKKAIASGAAEACKSEAKEQQSPAYSKDSPPPAVQEVVVEDEIFTNPMIDEAPEKKASILDKIKRLWHRLA